MIPATRRPLAIVVAILAWGALVLQLSILVRVFAEQGLPAGEAIVRFLSFFTILTNLMVAIVTTLSAFDAGGRGRCSQPFITGAATTFIIMVAVVYHLLLGHLWDPREEQLLADRLLHTAVPIAYVVWWFLAIPKGDLVWPDAFVWLVWPIGYFAAISVAGRVNAFYPYPFIDPERHGVVGVLGNSAYLTGAFLALGLIIVAVDEVLKPRPRAS